MCYNFHLTLVFQSKCWVRFMGATGGSIALRGHATTLADASDFTYVLEKMNILVKRGKGVRYTYSLLLGTCYKLDTLIQSKGKCKLGVYFVFRSECSSRTSKGG